MMLSPSSENVSQEISSIVWNLKVIIIFTESLPMPDKSHSQSPTLFMEDSIYLSLD